MHILLIELYIILNLLLRTLVSDTLFAWETYILLYSLKYGMCDTCNKAADEKVIMIFSNDSD
jgi:hypothetical protein